MVGKISESNFQQNSPCIFRIFIEGATFKLLHEGQDAHRPTCMRLVVLERYMNLVSKKKLPCIFIIFIEGAASNLLHGGRAARTLQKSVIEKFTIISSL